MRIKGSIVYVIGCVYNSSEDIGLKGLDKLDVGRLGATPKFCTLYPDVGSRIV